MNFKTRKKSYKSKKMLYLPPEEWKVFPDTHPAIIDRETWERVQELRKHKRRPTKAGKRGLFSGLAYCADCMSKLYFATHKVPRRTRTTMYAPTTRATRGAVPSTISGRRC